jgi:hypothetical protein
MSDESDGDEDKPEGATGEEEEDDQVKKDKKKKKPKRGDKYSYHGIV